MVSLNRCLYLRRRGEKYYANRKRKSNGDYELIISEYDRRSKHSKKLTKELKQLYGKHKFIKQAKKMGFSVKSQKVDEKGRIKIRVMG